VLRASAQHLIPLERGETSGLTAARLIHRADLAETTSGLTMTAPGAALRPTMLDQHGFTGYDKHILFVYKIRALGAGLKWE